MRHLCLCFTLIVCTLACPPAMAAEPGTAFVFHSHNQATLARHVPLPAATHHTASGSRVQIDWTSESHQDQQSNEWLSLDGETLRLAFTQRWDWRGLQWSAELPLLITGGGVLDQRIEDWHRWFGLPNGARTQQPRDHYQYVYQRDGITTLDVQGSDTALGDARIGVSRCTDAYCINGLLQLPTGDDDRLLGGGTGISAWLSTDYHLAQRWNGTLAAGTSLQGRVGALQDLQRTLTPFGWASLGYTLTERWSLGAQLYAHSPLYTHSTLGALTRMGLQTTFGLQYRSTSGVQVELAMQEDLITESSPDFVIQMSVAW